MKFLKHILIGFILSQSLAFANYNDVYIADIQYDWIKKTEVEKEAIISEIQDIIFENGVITKQDNLKSQLKNLIKDKNHLNNYYAASAGYKELDGKNISAFYFKNQKHIYMYAIQEKKDISRIYYYSALGKLKYVDYVYGEYPEYPYYSIQYKTSGKPVSAIYFVSKDTQYLFAPNGDFTGVWHKHNLYNKSSEIILTRTTY